MEFRLGFSSFCGIVVIRPDESESGDEFRVELIVVGLICCVGLVCTTTVQDPRSIGGDPDVRDWQ